MFTGIFQLSRRCFRLAAPFGRGKLALVLGIIFLNGVMQVVGVTSIFPFFALAADPDRIRNSRFGTMLLAHLPPMDHSTLLVAAGIVAVLLLFLSNATALAGEYVRTRYGHGLGHYLRGKMLAGFAERPYGYFLERHSGALLQKLLGDVMNFISGVLLPLLELISRVVTVAFLLLAIFLVQPVIALGAGLILGGFYLGTFLILRRRSRMLGEGLKEANRGTHITAQQFIQGIKPILVQGKARHFVENFNRHSSAQAGLYAWLPLYTHGPRYLIEPVALGGLVLAVVVLAAQGRSFSDILPNLTVLGLAAYRMLPSFQLLYGQITQISAMGYVVAEIEEEMAHLPPAGTEKTAAAADQSSAVAPVRFEKEIRLEQVTFCYAGAAKAVLQDFNLVIPKNQSIGISGTTGSGKSTLVDLLLGLHPAQSGGIRVDGQPLTEAQMPAWRKLIGYVPQEIYLLDASLAENIAFGLPPEEINPELLKEAARGAQILGFIENEVPGGWEALVGERGVRLSGGQRQRIGLARALYHRPQLLILDEATSALDTETESSVMQTIRSLQHSVTMVIVAHRLSTLEHCDQRIQLGSSPTPAPTPHQL